MPYILRSHTASNRIIPAASAPFNDSVSAPRAWARKRFGNRYKLGDFHYYHPGSDLNLNSSVFDMDRNMLVWSLASGQVLYAGRPSSHWQGVVFVRHTMPGGVYVDSCSAHLDQIFVSHRPGPFHLHFEICISDLVARDPGF